VSVHHSPIAIYRLLVSNLPSANKPPDKKSEAIWPSRDMSRRRWKCGRLRRLR
jgi:hypothetical protein